MADRRTKLAYAVGLAVKEIIRTQRGGAYFNTFTFEENIQDKAEAETRWRRFKARLLRRWPELRGVGVWQRQRRGAWHLHLVCDRFLPVVALRAWAVECGFGKMMKFRLIEGTGRRAYGGDVWSAKRVADYLVRYIVRDFGLNEHDDSGARVVCYIGGSRACTVSFAWVKGFAQIYRRGRALWSECFPGRQPTFDDYWFIIRLGWEDFTEDEQRAAVLGSDSVCKWWLPERVPW